MKTSRIFLAGLIGILFCTVTAVGSTCLAQSDAPAAEPQKDSKQPAAAQDSAATEKSTAKTEDAQPFEVKVADDNIVFSAVGPWKAITPRSRMLEAELKIPKVGDDQNDGRLTIMGAGGTIEANIVRWKGQYIQPDGSETSNKTKVEVKKIADQKVHLVDIVGTFLDSPGGPMAGGPKVERANYRMLAAIIETENYGNYFVKFYGPKATIDKNENAFKAMIKSLKIAE